MALSDKEKKLIEEFVDSDTVKAVESFSSTEDNDKNTVNKIASMFGFSGDFCNNQEQSEQKLVNSFIKNLQLLIQKTWVEQSDITLKEQLLFQLENLSKSQDSLANSYSDFLEIISNAVYLMFGQQTKSEDFCEYSLRIDPEFGIFWWYIKSLPKNSKWSSKKNLNAILLGMYFLANY